MLEILQKRLIATIIKNVDGIHTDQQAMEFFNEIEESQRTRLIEKTFLNLWQ